MIELLLDGKRSTGASGTKGARAGQQEIVALLLVSHLHDGRGGPGRHRPHHAENLVKSQRFVLDYQADPETRRAVRGSRA